MHPSELSAPPRVPLQCEIEIEPADHSSHLPVVRSRSHRRVPVSVAMDATDVPRPRTSGGGGGGGGIELAVKPPGQGIGDRLPASRTRFVGLGYARSGTAGDRGPVE